jgi:hypothetical protein
MILWLALALAVGIGVLRGGSLRDLGRLQLRSAWLVPPAVAVQVYAIFAPAGPAPLERWALPWARDYVWYGWPAVLVTGSTLLLAFVIVRNLSVPGMRLVAAGMACNLLVIVANGGLMPVSPQSLVEARLIEHTDTVALESKRPSAKDVVLRPEDTRFAVLSDWIVTPPVPRRKVLSVGDVVIAAGLGVVVVKAMGDARRRAQPAAIRAGMAVAALED